MAELQWTSSNFETEVLQSSQPVLVDFYAPWCGPCRMLAPVIAKLAAEYDGKVKVGKVNVEENPELALQFGIESTPTVVLFRQGKAVNSMVGLRPIQQFHSMLR